MSIITSIFNRDFIILFLQNWLWLAISHAFVACIVFLITKEKDKELILDIILICFIFFFFWAIVTTPLFYFFHVTSLEGN